MKEMYSYVINDMHVHYRVGNYDSHLHPGVLRKWGADEPSKEEDGA